MANKIKRKIKCKVVKTYPFTKEESKRFGVSYKPVFIVRKGKSDIGMASTKKKAENYVKLLKRVNKC